MNILALCGAAVITSLLALVLKKQGTDYSFILTICAVTLILLYLLASVVLAIDSVKNIFSKAQLSSEYIEVLLKCVGICFLTEFSSDCCKDASQTALSGVVLMAGRVCVLITALPLFTQFLDIALNLSGGSL